METQENAEKSRDPFKFLLENFLEFLDFIRLFHTNSNPVGLPFCPMLDVAKGFFGLFPREGIGDHFCLEVPRCYPDLALGCRHQSSAKSQKSVATPFFYTPPPPHFCPPPPEGFSGGRASMFKGGGANDILLLLLKKCLHYIFFRIKKN